MNFLATLVLSATIISQVHGGRLSPELEEECNKNPEKPVNVMLDVPEIDLTLLNLFKTDVTEKIIDDLQAIAEKGQRVIVDEIQRRYPNLNTKSYWIVNRVGIENVPCGTLRDIATITNDFFLRKAETANLAYTGTPTLQATTAASGKTEAKPQWGVSKVNAPMVWPTTKGTGIVVANIDSGVRGTHEALKDNYRGGKYGWLNGFTNSSAEAPTDGNGHGTHTMGSICGKLGVGVAPEATWIACKGCSDGGSCEEGALLTCGQWIMCPYNGDTKDCSLRPKLVSNSWGSMGPSGWYNGVIENWQKVGIIPIFAAGNDGPACLTTGSPGDQDNMITVGATTKDDTIPDFSSRGPSRATRKVKPEVSAPGHEIVSTWNTTDTAYATLSGTSMATPHVAGAVALLLAKNPSLTYKQILTALEKTAFQPSGLFKRQTCSCTALTLSLLTCPFQSAEWPNNAFGYGRIDVNEAFKSAPAT